MKLNDLGKKYLQSENDDRDFNIVCNGEIINTVIGEQRAEKFVEVLKRKGVTAIIEADEPTKDKSARARLDHNLRARGHGVEKSKKGKGSYVRSDKHKKPVSEGPLVVSRSSDLMSMLDVLLKDFKNKRPSDEELQALVKSLGYNMTKDGERTTLVKKGVEQVDEAEESHYDAQDIMSEDPPIGVDFDMDNLSKVDWSKHSPEEIKRFYATVDNLDFEDGQDISGEYRKAVNWLDKNVMNKLEGDDDLSEGNGNIRSALGAIAIIASLWGVNNNMAEKAYSASPQLQKLTAYLEVAKDHNDVRMIDQLEDRIENHKMRLDLGKGEVIGKDGNPIAVTYDKDAE